jgi:hypothetical protein
VLSWRTRSGPQKRCGNGEQGRDTPSISCCTKYFPGLISHETPGRLAMTCGAYNLAVTACAKHVRCDVYQNMLLTYHDICLLGQRPLSFACKKYKYIKIIKNVCVYRDKHILSYITIHIKHTPLHLIIPMAHHCACAIVQQLLLDTAETIAATMCVTGWLAFLENETNSNYELSYGVGSHSIHSSLAGSPWIFLGNMMAYGYPFTAPNTPLPLAG